MIGEGRVMNSRLLQQLVRFANPPEADNDAIMEFVVYVSERIRSLKECPAQAAKKSFLQGKYQRAVQGIDQHRRYLYLLNVL